MKIVSVVGARPQFVKACPVSTAIRTRHREVLVHTGQHYDWNLSRVFFEDLRLPEPDYNLGVGSGSHARQTARALIRLEGVLEREAPDVVLVYGDTNSTLAGALAAAKLRLPLAHVEAGPRTWDLNSPEEVNRVVADRLGRWLFCPTATALENLRREGLGDRAYLTGDVMLDALQRFRPLAWARPTLDRLGLGEKGYILFTLHRAENVDDGPRLARIVKVMLNLGRPVTFPAHPRTRRRLAQIGLWRRLEGTPVRAIDPVGYLDMLRLEMGAQCIVTDSGGVQKEAYLLEVPCLTLMSRTGWPETLVGGWNQMVGDAPESLPALLDRRPQGRPAPVFGDGCAAAQITSLLGVADAVGPVVGTAGPTAATAGEAGGLAATAGVAATDARRSLRDGR